MRYNRHHHVWWSKQYASKWWYLCIKLSQSCCYLISRTYYVFFSFFDLSEVSQVKDMVDCHKNIIQHCCIIDISQFFENRFCHHHNNSMNLNLQLQPNLIQFKKWYNHKISLTQSLSHLSITLQAVWCQYARYTSRHRTQFIPQYLLWFISW